MIYKIAFTAAFGLVLGFAGGYDWAKQKIKNCFCALLLVLGIIHLAHTGFNINVVADAICGLLAAGIPLLIISLWKNGLGGGDIKLVSAGGFILGTFPSLLALLFSNAIFIVVWVILRVRKKADTNTRLPYGPCYAIAALTAAILCGK